MRYKQIISPLLLTIVFMANIQTAQAQCSLINYTMDVPTINYSSGDGLGGPPDPRIGIEIVSGMASTGGSFIGMSCGVEANPASSNTTLDEVFSAVAGCGVGLAPGSVNINIDGFEEDGCGGDCSYDTGCFNNDDDFFGPTSYTFTIPKSGNCLVTNPTVVTQNYTGGPWNVTVRLVASYFINPPIAQGATAFACGAMPTLQVTSLAPGTTYEWYSNAAGTLPGAGIASGTGNSSYTPAPTEVNMNTVGDYDLYVRAVHACDANVKSTPTKVTVKVISPCPELTSATFSPIGNVCEQQSVSLSLTVANPNPLCPTTFVEGTDYLVIWKRNGTIIKDGRGTDGNAGTADDVINLSSTTYTVPFDDPTATCGSQDNSFEAQIICLKGSGPITAGSLNQYCSSTLKGQYGGYGSSTTNGYTNGCPGVGGSQGPANMVDYFNPCTGQFNATQFQTQGAPFSVALDLGFLPSCAQVSQVTYQLQGTSSSSCNSNYTSSWASEANFVFYTPAANPGASNAPGSFSWSNAGYVNCPVGSPDCNQTGGDFNFSNTIVYPPGITASGTWRLQFWDDYNDGGTLPDGEVNYYYLNVAYYYPAGCLPNTTRTATEAGGTATTLKVWDIPDASTDFVVPATGSVCTDDVVINCAGMQVLYANAVAGPYNLTTPPTAATIYYRVNYTDPAAPACAASTGSFATVALPAPTPVGNNSICQGATSVPVAQQLTAACANCPAPPAGAPITVTKTYSGPTVTIDAQTNAPAGSVIFTTADFPAGYVIQDVNITVTWQKTDGSCAAPASGTPFYNEMGLGITTPASSFDLFTPGFYTSNGSGPTSAITWTFDQSAAGPPPNTLPPANNTTYQPASGSLASLNGTAALGTYSMNGTDLAGSDPLCISSWSVTVIAVPPPAPPTPADISWYDSATGGTLQGTGSPFDPMGKISAQGPVDLNTPGNYTFYAQCGCGPCVGPRTPVIFTVVPKADGPSVDDVELCIGGTVPTITPIGSVIGAVFNVYALGGLLPLNPTPQTQFTSANLVAYGFNPAVATSTTYLVTEIVTTGALSCESAPSPFTITVNPAPVPTASNSGPYCEGETIEVSATGGAFYAWSGPGGYNAAGSPGFRFNATPAMAGTYTVTVTNLQGCTATASTDVVIKTTPVAPGATGSAICLGETVTAADFLAATAPTCPAVAGSTTTPGGTGSTGSIVADQLAGGPIGYDGAAVNFTFTYSLPAGAFITAIDYTIAGNQFNQFDDALINIGGTDVYVGTTSGGCPNCPYSVTGTVNGILGTDACGTPNSSNLNSFVAFAVDQINDFISPDGQLTTAAIVVHYQLPPVGTCAPTIPGGPANITWWNSPVGGTQQGTGLTLDPTGKIALQGAFDNNTPGVYTFFAESECASCTSDRTPVSIRVNESPFVLAFNDGPICAGGTATLTAVRGVSFAWDNGAGTGSPVTVSPATTTTYTVTVTDGNGCTATAATTVVVNPNPTATIGAATYTVCEDGTVVIDGNATGGTAPYTYIWGGTGAPYLVNANLSDPIFDASLATPGSIYTLTLQIQDGNGCVSTLANSSVTISTGGTPAISCPNNITISAQTGLCNAFLVAPAPTYNNGCYGALNLTYTLSGATTGSGSNIPAVTFNLGTTTVTYTVTDANNSTASASCSFTVIIEDNEPPIISCPASITQSSGAGSCTATITVPLPVVSDNCTASPSVSWSRSGATSGSGSGAASGTYNAGTTIVTYTATDGALNTAQCQITVTVVENILPTITCPGNLSRTVGADGTNNCTYTATLAEISPIVADNCTAVTVAGNVTYMAFGATSALGTGAATLSFNVGTTFITYTVNDASGNTRQCSFSITVTDNLLPTITCPSNPVTDVTDLNTCNALVSIAVPTTADNCGVASVVNSYNNTPNASGVYPLGTTAVTYTVTDTYGNTATCSFNVIVTDAQAPSIACPANVTAVTGPGAVTCSAVVAVNSPIVFDNCTASPAFSYVKTVATTGSGAGNAGGTYNVGTTTVTYTATDGASNTASCSFTVTVTDNTPPVITCTATPYTAPAATGTCSATVNVPAPPATDNCTASGSITYTWVRSGTTSGSGSGLNANGTYNVGTTTVTWTAADQYGNTSSCAVTVVVSDTQTPVLTCPAPVAAVNASSCSAFVTVPALGVSENCSGITGVTFNIYNTNNLGNNNTLVRSGVGTNASGSFPIGTSIIIYTVTDVTGNTSSCSTPVTVNDVIAPVIVCPTADDLTSTSSSDANGDCGAYIAIDPVTAYDNCNQITFAYVAIHEGVNNITASLTGAGVGNNASGIYPVGQTTITYTATDAYGNSSTCFIRVTINDDEAPGITCPNDVTQTADAGVCGAQVAMITPGTSDNCGVATVVNDYNNTGNASDYYPVGTTVVTWTVTDVNGNTGTCSVSVTITDDEAPVLGPCPANIQSCVPVVLFGTPTATDNCQVASVTPSQASATAFAVGTTVVTYTAADAAGNTSTCSFTVTVLPMQGTLTVSNFNGYGVSCNGGNNGSATLTMTSGFAPYTFAWSNGFTQTTSGASTASGLSAGNYSVTVTGNGVSCNYVRQFIIMQPLPLVCSITNTDVGCNTETGTATVNSSGGVAPYSYLWSNGATTQTAIGLAAGIYSVTLTDANGCVCINTVEIRDSGTIIGNGALVGNEYEGSGNTAIPTLYNVNTIEISGGTQPYQYDWNTSGYVQYSIHVNANGTVTITIVYADSATWDLTVTDSTCQSEELYFDNQPDSPTSSTVLDITNYVITPDNGSQNGTITLTVEGGTPCFGGGYNYAWEGPSNFTGLFTNGPAQTGLITGWYIVTVTDCTSPTPQSTIGWYWVPKTVRGRGKAELASLLTNQNMQVYPNPFDSETNISFELPETAQANVEVFDLTGKSVAVLFNGTANAEEPVSLQLNAGNLPAGSYLCRLTVEEWGASVVKQVFVIK